MRFYDRLTSPAAVPHGPSGLTFRPRSWLSTVPAIRERPQRLLDEHRQRRLIEHRALLEQRLHVLLPGARLGEPRKRARERGVMPAVRNTRSVVNEPQG